MRLAYFTLATILLTGCAGKQQAWTKPYLTQTQFYKDRDECKALNSRMTAIHFGYIGVPAETVDIWKFRSCMEARGYQFVDVPEGKKALEIT